ncbi:MAG TPA: response regulator [Syntrophorhabdaceae bacterium]|nr:response regulator [Syntrophorhabdaceae bacterium]
MDKKKILLIDDEEDFCFFVKLNLEKTGQYQVFTATDGMEGIRLAKQLKPDLIFLDIVMPKMDGRRVAQNLLEDESTKMIPVVFVSAVVKKDELARDGKIGGKDLIAKPFKSENLIEKIEQVLVNNHYSLIAIPFMLEHLTPAQHILLMALFATTLFFASISTRNTAYAGSTRTKIMVSARIPALTSLKILHQAREIIITDEDIRKGYIDMESASRIQVRNNNPAGYMLTLQGIQWPLREARVRGLANEIWITSGSAFVHQPYSRAAITAELSYRFLLAEDAKPGTYSWPLSISCQYF